MYKIYFKQAIEMLKQNKFITTITITGTAFAIMMIMVIVVVESIKTTSIAPEANRYRTMYIKWEMQSRKDNQGMNAGQVNYATYKEYLSDLKSPELISIHRNSLYISRIVNAKGSRERFSPFFIDADYNYWKIMSFSFIDGKPFGEAEVNAGLRQAVLSETMSKKLFGNEKAIGKTIEVDFQEYKVAGVVKDVSPIFSFASADIWIPYTSVNGFDRSSYIVLLLAKSRKDFDKIWKEVKGREQKFNATNSEFDLILQGPYDHSTQLINIASDLIPDVSGSRWRIGLIIAIALIVPAINLSSFSMSRIKRRTSEIGIRKAFGAKRHIILIQVLYENLITSLIGGIIGLLLSYCVILQMKQWLLGIDSDASIPILAFVSLSSFVGVFLMSLLLNLISAGIPAYRASRISIVDSLNQNNI